MRRPSPPVLAFSMLALVLVVVAATGGWSRTTSESGEGVPTPARAQPQNVPLGWIEEYPGGGQPSLVFRVERLQVTEEGWLVELGLENETTAPWAIGDAETSVARRFGLMIFRTGDQRELDQRNRAGELPAVREATTYAPPLPRILEPGRSWAGVMTGTGALPAGTYVRVVLGAFTAVPEPPEGLDSPVTWITDHAHGL
jgi:hypothetical protein